jgi:hypothetical protein
MRVETDIKITLGSIGTPNYLELMELGCFEWFVNFFDEFTEASDEEERRRKRRYEEGGGRTLCKEEDGRSSD